MSHLETCLFEFESILTPKPWGGKQLQTVLNKKIDDTIQCGESWEISPIKGSVSKVISSPYQGYSLNALCRVFGASFLGDKVANLYEDKFPLLFKFIATQSPLSIQVHPNDAQARLRGEPFGKSEMWYILDSSSESQIVLGLVEELNADTLENHIQSGTIENVLNVYQPKKYDYYWVPAGQIHAIGADILLLEVQQASNTTYRIYDYKRKFDGAERELHIEEAKQVSSLHPYQSEMRKTSPHESSLKNNIHTSQEFTINEYRITNNMKRALKALDSFVVYIGVEGETTIHFENQNYLLDKGKTILVPAIVEELYFENVENSPSLFLEVYI